MGDGSSWISRVSFTISLSFLAVATLSSREAVAQSEEFIFLPIYWEHIEKPTDFFDDIRNGVRSCLEIPECATAVAAAETYVGMPPGSIAGTIAVVDAAGFGPRTRVSGFARSQDFPTVSGYSFCTVSAYVQSEGKTRPGEYDLAAKADLLRIYTFVDNPNWMQPERHVKAWQFVTLVRNDLLAAKRQSGVCNIKDCWNVGLHCVGGICDVQKIGEYPQLLATYGHIPSCIGVP